MAHACSTNTRKRNWTESQQLSDSDSVNTQSSATVRDNSSSVYLYKRSNTDPTVEEHNISERANPPTLYDNNFSNCIGNQISPRGRSINDVGNAISEDAYLRPTRGPSNDHIGANERRIENVYDEPLSNTFPARDRHACASGQNNPTASQNDNTETPAPVVHLPMKRSTSCVSDSYKCKCIVLAVFNVFLIALTAASVHVIMTSSQQYVARNSTADPLPPPQPPQPQCSGVIDEKGPEYCMDCNTLQEHTGTEFLKTYNTSETEDGCCFGSCQGMDALVSQITQQQFGNVSQPTNLFIHVHGSKARKLMRGDNQYGIEWQKKTHVGFLSALDEFDVIINTPGFYFIYTDVNFQMTSSTVGLNYNVTKTLPNGSQKTIDEVSSSCIYEQRTTRQHSVKTATLSFIDHGSKVGVRIAGDDVDTLYNSASFPHKFGLVFIAPP